MICKLLLCSFLCVAARRNQPSAGSDESGIGLPPKSPTSDRPDSTWVMDPNIETWKKYFALPASRKVLRVLDPDCVKKGACLFWDSCPVQINGIAMSTCPSEGTPYKLDFLRLVGRDLRSNPKSLKLCHYQESYMLKHADKFILTSLAVLEAKLEKQEKSKSKFRAGQIDQLRKFLFTAGQMYAQYLSTWTQPLSAEVCEMYFPLQQRDHLLDEWARKISTYRHQQVKLLAQAKNFKPSDKDVHNGKIFNLERTLQSIDDKMNALFQLQYLDSCSFIQRLEEILKGQVEQKTQVDPQRRVELKVKSWDRSENWEFRRSRSELGWWYFYHLITGERTWEPWFPMYCCQDKVNNAKRIYYYINVFTGESSLSPPTERWKKALELSGGINRPLPPGPQKVTTWATMPDSGKVPWRHPKLLIAPPWPFQAAATPGGGAILFHNQQTHETTWHPWFRMSRSSGRVDYVNVITGEETSQKPMFWSDLPNIDQEKSMGGPTQAAPSHGGSNSSVESELAPIGLRLGLD